MYALTSLQRQTSFSFSWAAFPAALPAAKFPPCVQSPEVKVPSLWLLSIHQVSSS
jgi:hypothetical protein